MKLNITTKIIIGFILGIIVGQIMHTQLSEDQIADASKNIKLLGDIFLRSIHLIVGPLIFCTLSVGVAKLGDFKLVGRIGLKTLAYFYFATILSLVVGLVFVNITRPGEFGTWKLPATGIETGVVAKPLKTFKDFLFELFPDNAIQAFAENKTLGIIMISIVFGIALATMGEHGKKISKGIDWIGEAIFKVVAYIMLLAPFAVFASMTNVIAQNGLGVLVSYAYLVICFFAALAFFIFVVLWSICFFLKIPYWRLMKEMKEAILLSFSTASSEASMPKQIESLKRLGISDRIIGFVLPLGYSFNLDGSMMYMTFATGFIAQAYGMPLNLDQQITMLLTLLLASKGIAGVPRASLVVIMGTMTLFGLPQEGLVLLLGIDPFLDMGRSATSVVGNAVATAVVSKWEGEVITPEV
jgi:Na+/H+-dicarboxylate symporter